MFCYLPELSEVCERCTHNYSIELVVCPHCEDLTDIAIEKLIESKELTLDANRPLGWFLLIVAAVGIFLLILLNLNL